MGRGLFYLIVGAVAAWSLYSRFADDDPEERPPPSRPRSPSPSRRRDAWQTASSRVNHPPVGTFGRPRSPPTGRWQANDTPVNTYRPPSPSHRRDAWQTASSRVNHPPVGTSTSFGQPPHTPSRRRDDLQANDPQVGTSTPFGQPPHTPSRRRDDRLANDTPVKTYRPQSSSPALQFTVDGCLDSSRVEDPQAKTHASVSHPRSPSPHIPSRRRGDQQTADSEPEVEYPPLETSVSLRDRAKQEGDWRSECYQKSKKVHKLRLHALAQAYSTQAKDHTRTMKSLNARASAMIFKENNKNRPPGEIDLHGLYVKEAISYANTALKEARQRDDSEICLIVGKGNHSDGGIARLKPAIKSAMRKRKVHVHVDPNNPGRLRLVI